MGLLDFIQQQPILQNQVIGAKSPQERAYDEMLNRQNQARKKENIDNIMSGIGTGLNGLGKIIANATVKNPWQQKAVADSLNANDDRLQQQMKDYAEKMAGSRRNFVDEAKEQLALANADADKQYAREQDEAKFAYQKLMDELKQQNFDKQFGFNSQQSVIDNALKQAQKNKINAETEAIINANSPEAIEAKEKELKDKELKEARKKQLETYVATARDLFNKGKIDNKTLMAIENNPALTETLIPAKTLFWKSSSKMKLGDKDSLGYEIMIDKDGNTARVYKDGRIEEIR